MPHDEISRDHRQRLWAMALIVLALGFYAVWGGSAIFTLSPTVDELQHSAGAWNVRFQGDYRPDRENPPLWLHWIGLFLSEDDVGTGITPAVWQRMRYGVTPPYEYCDILEREDVCDVEPFVRKARLPMFLVALALGAAVTAAAWRYAGPIGGVAVAVCFAFEPLVLGHGPLVKNDVVLAVCFLGAAVGLAELCRHGGWRWAALLAICCGAAINVKFSGVLLLTSIVPLGLFIRAVSPAPWRLGFSMLETVPARLGAAAVIWTFVCLTTWGCIWASYGCRFNPTPGDERFDIQGLVMRSAAGELAARRAATGDADQSRPAAEVLRDWKPPLFLRGLVFAHEHRLLPEAAIAGLIFTHGSLLFRPAFLCGHYSDSGFTLFFPACWLFKTPVTLVALHILGIAAVCQSWRTYGLLFLPVPIYLAAAMAGRINLGLRHMAPLYPFLMIAVGIFAAQVWQAWPRRRAACAGLAVLVFLAAEILPRRLEYIQFFSFPCGGPRGGLELLSDSNLDWGQDLYRLVAWQQRYPEEEIFLCYFGNHDPRKAGLRYHNTVGSWAPGPPEEPTSGSIYAISATNLQGTYRSDDLRRRLAEQRRHQPLDVLGGTIYLYRVP